MPEVTLTPEGGMPTRSDLDALFARYELAQAPLVERWNEDEKFYLGTFEFPVPRNVRVTIPATGRNAIEVPAQHIIPDYPRVIREGRKRKRPANDDAVEAALLGFLKEVAYLSPTPPLHEAIKLQLLRGVAYLCGPWFNLAQFEAGMPGYCWFTTEDPRNVLCEPGDEPSQAFLFWRLTVAEMRQLARRQQNYKSFDPRGRHDMEEITLVEWYWHVPDPDKGGLNSGLYACYIKEDPGFLTPPRASGYPYLPVERVYSGYGLRTRGATPLQSAVSILNEQAKSLLIEEAAALSVESSVVATSGWERYRAPPGYNEEDILIDYTPGSVSRIPPEVLPMQDPQLPRAALVHYANVADALEQALYAGVVGGQRPVGVSTASGLAILSGQARLKFGPPLRMLETGTARLLSKLGRLLAYQSEVLSPRTRYQFMGAAVEPRDFGGDYTVGVQFFSESAEDRNVRIQTGNTLWGRVPVKTIWEEYYGLTDFESTAEQYIFEKIVLSDQFIAQLAQQMGFLPGPQAMPAPFAGRAGRVGRAPAPVGGLGALRQLFEAAQENRAARPESAFIPAQPGTVEGLGSVMRLFGNMGRGRYVR
jgi:hypothetical protein